MTALPVGHFFARLRFNRWAAGDQACYFDGVDGCTHIIDRLLTDLPQLERMGRASRARYCEAFTWVQILGQYELLLIPHSIAALQGQGGVGKSTSS